MNHSATLQPPLRKFLPVDFKITDWSALEPFFMELLNRPLNNAEQLLDWLKDSSELEAVISEDACWRQIKMTCDTTDPALEESFVFFVTQIQPQIQPLADRLNRKLIECPFVNNLDTNKYFTYLRNIHKSIELYRENNIALQSELSVLGQQFGTISGKMTIEVDGKEYTLQQAAKFLENHDRNIRETVYRKINERRLQDKEELDQLFSTLLSKRHQVALNAGFENYRDYKFKELGRFDYSKKECEDFHEAVKAEVLPLVTKIYERKKAKLGLESLRPWDIDAEPTGTKPLRPFEKGNELLEKSIDCFEELDPFFADCLRTMDKMGRFDLESRKGKAPGGYNCPLAETGAPFIFMNAAGQMSDVTTMVHEGGHAVHSFLAHPLELSGFKEYPMEIAEVASMTMELFSMDHWEVFFQNPEELKRAKEHQLERVITVFPWIATIDKFQHWVYQNPTHSSIERSQKWVEIMDEFTSPALDTSGLENFRAFGWQRQLHLFEVPFYYIEYGIAQLGAIGIWKNFKENKPQAIEKYKDALSKGGMLTLPELYKTAGIEFNFTKDHIHNLMNFVQEQLEEIIN
jgi:oligoendopeptidase F